MPATDKQPQMTVSCPNALANASVINSSCTACLPATACYYPGDRVTPCAAQGLQGRGTGGGHERDPGHGLQVRASLAKP